VSDPDDHDLDFLIVYFVDDPVSRNSNSIQFRVGEFDGTGRARVVCQHLDFFKDCTLDPFLQASEFLNGAWFESDIHFSDFLVARNENSE
jgi:hypothetical protein